MIQVHAVELERRASSVKMEGIQKARAKIRGSMREFAGDVRQSVVEGLRELCVTAVKVVDDLIVTADGRVQGEGSGSG